jgi:hypothetical protein
MSPAKPGMMSVRAIDFKVRNCVGFIGAASHPVIFSNLCGPSPDAWCTPSQTFYSRVAGSNDNQ